MRALVALCLALLGTSLAPVSASATTGDPSEELRPSLAAPAPSAAPVAADLVLDRVEQSAPADADAAAQLGPRGSFWWLVGVVVVAGVILAVLL